MALAGEQYRARAMLAKTAEFAENRVLWLNTPGKCAFERILKGIFWRA